jgi:putative transposase
MTAHLRRVGRDVGRKRVRRLMRRMGLAAVYQRPRTRMPHSNIGSFPYLLRDLTIERPNHVWCADITYISMRRGFLYLTAVMDWATRKVLSKRVSNTMDAEFCLEALKEAFARHGKPAIFNTDQVSQFTSTEFTKSMKDTKIRISMDGHGRWLDNVFVERLWHSLPYECVCLHAFETGSELRVARKGWIEFYKRGALTRRSPGGPPTKPTGCHRRLAA